MNQHRRRSELRAFKHEVAGELVTHLVEADDPSLDREPLLSRARSFWLAAIPARKPRCISCGVSFTEAAVLPAAYLFAQALGLSGVASVSIFCDQCW